MKYGVKIKLAPLPPNEWDEGKKESMTIVYLVLKESFKISTGYQNPFVVC